MRKCSVARARKTESISLRLNISCCVTSSHTRRGAWTPTSNAGEASGTARPSPERPNLRARSPLRFANPRARRQIVLSDRGARARRGRRARTSDRLRRALLRAICPSSSLNLPVDEGRERGSGRESVGGAPHRSRIHSCTKREWPDAPPDSVTAGRRNRKSTPAIVRPVSART